MGPEKLPIEMRRASRKTQKPSADRKFPVRLGCDYSIRGINCHGWMLDGRLFGAKAGETGIADCQTAPQTLRWPGQVFVFRLPFFGTCLANEPYLSHK